MKKFLLKKDFDFKFNLKFKHKFILLIFFLVSLVSVSIMISTVFLLNNGKNKIEKGIAQKLDSLKKENIKEFSDFAKIAEVGINQASALPAISMAKENQEKFVNIAQNSISKLSLQIDKNVNEQNEIVNKGLDDLLGSSKDYITKIMDFDNKSLYVLANLATFNLNALSASSIDSLRRFQLIITNYKKMLEKEQGQLSEKIDNLIIEVMTKLEEDEQSSELITEFLMEALENLKVQTIENQNNYYYKLCDLFELQSNVVTEELKLVRKKVEYAINLELSHSGTKQNEQMDIVINNLLNTQLSIQGKINSYTEKLKLAINELKINLPNQLKEAGDEVSNLLEEQGIEAKRKIDQARNDVNLKIKKSTEDTTKNFTLSIAESKNVISDLLKQSSKRTFSVSLLIALICIVISLTLGLFIIRTITKPINLITQTAHAIAEGDLDQRVNIIQKDEIGEMAKALNYMVDSQRKLLNNLKYLPTPIFEINKNYNIVYINDSGADFVGIPSKDCLGQKCYDLFKTSECNTEKCSALCAMKTKSLSKRETRANPGKLKNIPLSYTSLPIEENNNINGALIFIVDQSKIYEIVDEVRNINQKLNNNSKELSAAAEQMSSTSQIMYMKADSVLLDTTRLTSNVANVASSIEQSSSSISNAASMSEEMSTGFKNVSDMMQDTKDHLQVIAKTGEQLSAEVINIATSIEEMTTSMTKVAQNTSKASQISKDANEKISEINEKMKTLVSSSKQIGHVIGMIKKIADQTNMLALNAAIEAAGAGEAGKGFAVVASEVKELASQSANATDEIADQIEGIQISTNDVENAIHKINAIINEIVLINEDIALSVKEQTTTATDISRTISFSAQNARLVATDSGSEYDRMESLADSANQSSIISNELAKNIGQISNRASEIANSSDLAYKGTQKISVNIKEINNAAKDTVHGANITSKSSNELLNMANTLNNIINKFKI